MAKVPSSHFTSDPGGRNREDAQGRAGCSRPSQHRPPPAHPHPCSLFSGTCLPGVGDSAAQLPLSTGEPPAPHGPWPTSTGGTQILPTGESGVSSARLPVRSTFLGPGCSWVTHARPPAALSRRAGRTSWDPTQSTSIFTLITGGYCPFFPLYFQDDDGLLRPFVHQQSQRLKDFGELLESSLWRLKSDVARIVREKRAACCTPASVGR